MRRHSTIFVSVGVLVVAIALGLTASRKSLPEIEHDAYIWQRSWKTSLLESISGNKDLVRAWRVLAAHAGPAGNLIPVSIHAKALVESGRALVMVVRIDGQLPNLDQSHIIDEVLALRERWRAQGLTAVLVHPGWVRTDMGGERAQISVETSVRGIATGTDP